MYVYTRATPLLEQDPPIFFFSKFRCQIRNFEAPLIPPDRYILLATKLLTWHVFFWHCLQVHPAAEGHPAAGTSARRRSARARASRTESRSRASATARRPTRTRIKRHRRTRPPPRRQPPPPSSVPSARSGSKTRTSCSARPSSCINSVFRARAKVSNVKEPVLRLVTPFFPPSPTPPRRYRFSFTTP